LIEEDGMKKLLALSFVIPLTLALAGPAYAQAKKKAAKAAPTEKTYYGDVSDSMCGAKHKMAGSPAECTKACVKSGGKYVFVYRGKVWEISNQDFTDLATLAGEHVRLKGTRSPDGKSVTIAELTKSTPSKHAAKAKKSA
jgi:hypothetical protein